MGSVNGKLNLLCGFFPHALYSTFQGWYNHSTKILVKMNGTVKKIWITNFEQNAPLNNPVYHQKLGHQNTLKINRME